MKAIAVTKPDMAVLNRDRMGLSSFGVLAALFSEEILQRSQRQLGVWPPAPLDLLQEETEENMGQNAHGPINVNLDLTLILKNLREEQKKEQKKRAETIQTMEKLMERIVLREQTLRVQESTQQINIRASGIGQSHIIQTIRTPPPYHGLEPVSEVTAVPSAGGWHPRWRQEHPGFSPERQIPEEIGNSIVLPDALRRRRQQALEEAAFGAAVDRVQELLQKDGPGKTLNREELRREISRAVEATLAQQQGRSVQDSEFQTLAGIDAEQTKHSNEADHKRAIVKAGRDTESVRVREAPGPGHSDHRDQLIYREEADALTEFAGQTSASAETTYTRKNQASSVQGLAADSSKQKSISTKKNISDSKSSDKILDPTAVPETWTASSSREIGFDHKTEKQAIPQGDTVIERNVQPLRDIEESELVYEEENPATEVQLGSLTIPTSGQPSESTQERIETTELVHREEVPVESLRQTVLPAVPATGQPSDSTPGEVDTTELVHREDVPVESLRQTVLPAVPATGQPSESTQERIETTELVHREEVPVESLRRTVLPAVPATGQLLELAQDQVETTELVHREEVPVERWRQMVLPAVPATGQLLELAQDQVKTTELVHREDVPIESLEQTVLPAVPATGQLLELVQDQVETTELVHREEVPVESLRQTVLPTVPVNDQSLESTQSRVENTGLVHQEEVPVERQRKTDLPAVPATGQLLELVQDQVETTELVYREDVPVESLEQTVLPAVPATGQPSDSTPGEVETTELVHREDVPVESLRQTVLPAVPATGQLLELAQDQVETTELVHREENPVERQRQTVLPAVPATGQPADSTPGEVDMTELVHREDVPVESLRQMVLPAVPATGQPSDSTPGEVDTTELVHREEVPVGDPRQSGFPVAPVNEQSVNSLQGQIQATELVHRIDGEEQLKAKLPAIVQMEIKKADQSKPLYQKQEDDKSFHPPMGISGKGRDLWMIRTPQTELVHRSDHHAGISAKYGQGPQVAHLFVSRNIRMLHHQMIQQQSAVVPFHSQVDRPAELSYLQMPMHAPDEEGKKESAGTALPQWAQKLLEKPNGPTFRFDRYASSGQLTQPMPQETQRQIQWTAPGTVPPTPNITYHTKPPAEPMLPVQTAKLSDVELRRAADKIYHMIEERLRREMRRSGR